MAEVSGGAGGGCSGIWDESCGGTTGSRGCSSDAGEGDYHVSLTRGREDSLTTNLIIIE